MPELKALACLAKDLGHPLPICCVKWHGTSGRQQSSQLMVSREQLLTQA